MCIFQIQTLDRCVEINVSLQSFDVVYCCEVEMWVFFCLKNELIDR